MVITLFGICRPRAREAQLTAGYISPHNYCLELGKALAFPAILLTATSSVSRVVCFMIQLTAPELVLVYSTMPCIKDILAAHDFGSLIFVHKLDNKQSCSLAVVQRPCLELKRKFLLRTKPSSSNARSYMREQLYVARPNSHRFESSSCMLYLKAALGKSGTMVPYYVATHARVTTGFATKYLHILSP